MKLLRLIVLILCCSYALNLAYSQNCPPGSVYPNPQINSSFAPDSSCLDSTRNGSAPDGKHSCLGACENSYTTYCTMFVTGDTYLWNVIGGTIIGSPTSNCVTVLWGPAGPGSIKITETNSVGCTATKEQCVQIINSPIAAFTVPALVCKNVPLNFINQSVGALTYFWNFGDGNTSTLASPVHAYTIAGPHLVTLVAYNKCGCKDSATFTITVSNLSGPVISCPATVCASAQACYSTVSGCPNAVYHWLVNGGTIVGPPNLNHICVQWGAGPQGTVSLFITGCDSVCPDTTTALIPIISTNGPITGNLVVCPSSNETYSLPLWPGTYYSWTLSGGGTVISGQNTNAIAIHWGLNPGTYTLSATWNNILLGCGGNATITINIRDVFQLFGQTGPFCIGSTTNFFANANANWTVTGGTFTGNGTSSIAVTWTSGGTHTVTAVPLNPSAYCNPSASLTVTVATVPPAVAINGPPVICPGGTYQYTATPSGPGFTLLWTVSGGTIIGSNAANPVSVQWSGPGTISVQQVQTTPPFCPSPPISLPVTVLSIGSITGSNNVCMDQTSTFTCGGPNPGIVYTWSIVDGSGNPSPAGSITSGQGTNSITVLWHGPGGPAVVKLKVCSTTLTLPVTINPKPNPTITMTGKICNPGGQVTLTASAGTQYLWSTGAINTPSIVVLLPGSYWVKVTNAAGCSDTARITVPVSPGPVASISTPNQTTFCTPPAPVFTDTLYALQGPGYTYLWSPGNQTTPTITVSSTGSYSCVVTDASGCSSTSNVITITAGPCGPGGCTPTGSISFTITAPICNPVAFNGSSSGITSPSWNFGDPTSGSNTSVLTNPTHLFTHAGWFTVTYSGIDATGCLNSVSHAVPIPLAADFSFAGQCGIIQFTDLSTFLPPNSITGWSWTFPSGSPPTSNAQNPAVVFPAPGTYNVTLSVSNALCTVSITKPVVVAAPPSAAFILPATACAGTDIALLGSGAPAVSWLWDFGDAQTSGLQNTSHAWATAGTYTVKLTVKDANGCTNIVSHTITITTPSTVCPITPTNPPPVCQGGSVLLTSSPASGYQWQLNGTNIGGATLQTYLATQTGSYTVIDTDAGGCVCKSPPVSVVVNPLPPATITPNISPVICGSGTITLTAPAGPYSYLWSDASTGQTVTVFLNTPGVYVYTVTVTDSNTPPCSAVSLPFTINVYPQPPNPTITASGPTALCKGDSVTLTSSAPINNSWNTGATTQSITVTLPGVYTVTVTNIHGCNSSASITVTSNVPNLSLFPFGCDKLCDTVKIPGPIGPFIGYYTYQWFYNGNPIPPPNGTNDTLTPVGSGTYTLILTGPGPTFCKDTSGPYNLTLHDCDSTNCHGKICGRKWNDANGNHKFNYGTEFGIANWRICLVKCNIDHYPTKDTIECTLTDSLGFYCFNNLCAGDYCVVEEGKPGWEQTWPVSPPFYHVTLTDSQSIGGLDFGNKKKCIHIIITHDTVGVETNPILTAATVIPTAYPWPLRISYSSNGGNSWQTVFDGLFSINPNVNPILPCPPGTYSIVRKHLANYKFDRIYVNDTLRSDNGDSVVVSIPDSSGGATILLLNVFAPDSALRFRTFTADQLAGGDQVKPVKRSKPRKPVVMPNTANVIDEIFKQGGALLVGSPAQFNSAGKEKGYLQPHNQSDVFKTFNAKGVVHTGKPRGLDYIKGKPILHRQKSLPATKHNNRLMANLLALQVNIAASQTAPPKTPGGFGDLLYDNGGTDPLDGMTINEIADYANNLMTNWEYNDSTLYISLNTAIEMINGAFAKALPFDLTDTLVWMRGKFQLGGTKALMDVPFLKQVTGATPTTQKIRPLPGSQAPSQFMLNQNYPNPFNPTTTISFTIPAEATVTLRIYNVLGQEVATLIDREVMDEGDQQVDFDAHRLSSGVYFYQLSAQTTPDAESGSTGKTYFSTKKMLLLR